MRAFKEAWICYGHGDQDDYFSIIVFEDPSSMKFRFSKIVHILYSEVEE